MIPRDLIRDPEDVARVQAFARQAAALTPEAWDRIGVRCGALDAHTFEAVLGRLELAARANTPPANPYQKPLVGSVMGFMGVVWSTLEEVVARLPFDDLERATKSDRDPGLSAVLEIAQLARREQRRHPGAAAALRIVGRALSIYSKSVPDRFDAIYAPFEPEIPLASLTATEAPATA